MGWSAFNRSVRSGKRQAASMNKAPLYYGQCDLSIHLSVNLECSNTVEKSYMNISKLHKNAVITFDKR